MTTYTKNYLLFIPWHFPLHKDATISGVSRKAQKEFELHYPAIYNYLLQKKDLLSKRNKTETGIRYEWYALQRCAASYFEEFANDKIIWGNLSNKPSFSYDSSKSYINAPAVMISVPDKFLLGLLNSSSLWFYLKLAAGRQGGYIEAKPMYVEKLPIIVMSKRFR
ncbi:MAG: hypothetical protein IPO25_22670 [Saprospiraceae bacterium]|nr:hypothetical protein [Saprospiraceae bacterium]